MYRPTHYKLYELVPRQLFESVSHDLLWLVFDDRMLMAADIIREKYGPMVINNWFSGGVYQYSGYRPHDCQVGAPWSQHRFGRALDLHPVKADVNEIRYKIRRREICSGLITCIEDGVSWLHIDCRLPESGGKIKVVRP